MTNKHIVVCLLTVIALCLMTLALLQIGYQIGQASILMTMKCTELDINDK